MILRPCAYCGSELEEGALFCGTCGHAAGADVEPPSLPTVVREPVRAPEDRDDDPLEADEEQELDDGSDIQPDPGVPGPEPVTGAETTEVRVAVPEVPATRAPAEPLLPVPTLAATAPHPVLRSMPALPDGLELFVLQFSTGESVTVTGEGLIGRAPVREPGEVMDQLVPLADAGRSVSKTHLAFGQENGRFWVTDRFSTNGTVLRAPGAPSQRLEPGRRYPLTRGSRVDIGDQFFVVS